MRLQGSDGGNLTVLAEQIVDMLRLLAEQIVVFLLKVCSLRIQSGSWSFIIEYKYAGRTRRLIEYSANVTANRFTYINRSLIYVLHLCPQQHMFHH